MSFSSSLFDSPACSGPSDVYHDSKTVMDAWISELHGRVLVDDRPVEDFIDLFVPCSQSTPYSTAPINVPPSPFWRYQPEDGREVQNYPGLNDGLSSIIQSFPIDYRPSFHTTRDARYAFPFSAFAKNHCVSSPDISISFPGERRFNDQTLRTHKWHKIAGVIEAKDTKAKDPFPKAGEAHTSTIIQIVRNARTLMLTHGFLSVYVVGIYGDIGRIVRFDRTCAIVSQGFNIRAQPALLQRFFWHWTHPRVGTTVVGADPTIRRLTGEEEKWLCIQLERSQPFERTFIQPEHYRRIEVYNERDNSMSAYFAYKLIQVNARLLSRSTMVWKVVEDRYSQDPDALEPVKTRILKDSWRQLVRKSEASFYERLSTAIPEENYFGIARFVCGGDLGQMELRDWETTSPNADMMENERELRLGMAPGDLGHEEGLSGAADSENAADIGGDAASTPPNPHGSLPYPQHQTFSWKIMQGAYYTYLERSHMRFVVENVGRPLTEFKTTKQLVRAMMDALKGHKLAWEVAGVLHRDISIGNILITDEATVDGCQGFIHDFDYSFMSAVPPGEEDDEASSEDPDDSRKERTGTHYFIAYEILDQAGSVIHRHYHDIESCYWVLLWIVLRHTEHNLGQGQCEKIFKLEDADSSTDAKWCWMTKPKDPLKFKDNQPLTDLMMAFKALVKRQIELIGTDSEPVLTYDAVLEIFEQALDQEGWPEEDYVNCHLLDAVEGSANGKEPRIVFPQPSLVANPPRSKLPPPIARNALSAPANAFRLPCKRGSGALIPESIPEGTVVLGTSSDSTAPGPSTLQERDRSIGPSKRRKVAVPSHSAGPIMGPPPVPAHPYNTRRSKEKTPNSPRATSTGNRSRRSRR